MLGGKRVGTFEGVGRNVVVLQGESSLDVEGRRPEERVLIQKDTNDLIC